MVGQELTVLSVECSQIVLADVMFPMDVFVKMGNWMAFAQLETALLYYQDRNPIVHECEHTVDKKHFW